MFLKYVKLFGSVDFLAQSSHRRDGFLIHFNPSSTQKPSGTNERPY